MRIAILGNQDSILGFKALGLDCFGVYTQEEAEKKVDEIYEKKGCGILFITEDWMEKLKIKLDDLKNTALPAVIAIPGVRGATGEGERELKNIVEQAVGSDILFNE
ncbi:V-type ATP synthase subunit F [Patescibacteria group bacterium]|nr:V-type ATP synthase subunit F [Patescibacteria group bacterium]MBU4512024.1 V-type ATP synthase subunit F [Patescibacteria group bacterium]MCG2693199.1 V-type ATP synthase subunit F [Candidatus Parcubacteria bacterium]